LIPPAYYADLACERGRCYLNDLLVWDGSTAGGSVRGGKRRTKEEERKAVFQEAERAWGNGVSLTFWVLVGMPLTFGLL
jgi:hypothetical protein